VLLDTWLFATVCELRGPEEPNLSLVTLAPNFGTQEIGFSDSAATLLMVGRCSERTAVAVGAGPALVADTLPRLDAVAVLAARFRQTLVAPDTGPALSTPATNDSLSHTPLISAASINEQLS